MSSVYIAASVEFYVTARTPFWYHQRNLLQP